MLSGKGKSKHPSIFGCDLTTPKSPGEKLRPSGCLLRTLCSQWPGHLPVGSVWVASHKSLLS